MNRTIVFARAVLAASVALLCLGGQAQAQTYPSRPVKLVSPYGAGGSNDISARILADALGSKLGQQVVVENKPGAGTRLATEHVAHAAPDGYTLLWAAAPFAINTAAGIAQRYDVHKDFVAVGPRVLGPIFLIVNANSPARTVADFVRLAREKPDGVTVASPGAGSGPHLTAELFGQVGKFKLLSVHYRGDATAYTELLAGRADATLTAITSALPFIKAGKLRVLAVASEQRTPVYPDAPTFAEQGYPGMVGYGWFGLVAPAGTPPAITERLNREASAVLADAHTRSKLLGLGLEPHPERGSAFSAFIDQEIGKWGKLIQARGIKLD
ncbi:tripartite tricarboxylate transporter substrate binding protein [Cupriavidus sp. MP-37]|uniref:Bug family tripartite tricarboxylate transporter substrate binding protein n=1 Tax=Cupriavidus sp. MP-37 TaxID=2884455 RepID=UPI001D0B5E6E|nr:tripartite tricarboxylate transporter substrate binding protein [Cupriavidus sp. MP-37]UDM53587.1 tripartite tricarboxylate transporter substrate binding protein [Cupriavidus sp. MP-37]